MNETQKSKFQDLVLHFLELSLSVKATTETLTAAYLLFEAAVEKLILDIIKENNEQKRSR